MATFDEALAVLRATEDAHETYARASHDEVRLTEAAIGHPLPDWYTRFVTEFSNGAYLYRVQEVSAVGRGNPQIAPIQEIHRLRHAAPEDQIDFREGGQTAYKHLTPFSLDSNGNEWCFVVSDGAPGGEYEVAYLDTSEAGRLYGRLSGFAEWLSILIANPQDEVIRTLYDDDVIYNELMLG